MHAPSERVAQWGLRHKPESVQRARELVADIAESWGFGDVLYEVRLVTSELVTNAVEHGGEPIEITVSEFEDDLLIQVADGGEMWREEDRSQDPESLDEHGRGLTLIEAFAKCGVYHLNVNGPGKVVWAQIPRQRLPES